MSRRHLGKRDAKEIAKDRIDKLFDLASDEGSKGNLERAKRYVELALRIGERHKVPPRHKRTYCSKCHAYFVPPSNVRVRTRSGRISITCLSCGTIQRYPLAKRMQR